jgi:hypothetical protein
VFFRTSLIGALEYLEIPCRPTSVPGSCDAREEKCTGLPLEALPIIGKDAMTRQATIATSGPDCRIDILSLQRIDGA